MQADWVTSPGASLQTDLSAVQAVAVQNGITAGVLGFIEVEAALIPGGTFRCWLSPALLHKCQFFRV